MTPTRKQGSLVIAHVKSSNRGCSIKKLFLKTSQYSLESTCVFTCNFIKKRLQHGFFSCEYCDFFKSNCFEEHLQVAAPQWKLQPCQRTCPMKFKQFYQYRVPKQDIHCPIKSDSLIKF